MKKKLTAILEEKRRYKLDLLTATNDLQKQVTINIKNQNSIAAIKATCLEYKQEIQTQKEEHEEQKSIFRNEIAQLYNTVLTKENDIIKYKENNSKMKTQISTIKKLCAKALEQLQKAEKDRDYYDDLDTHKTEEILEMNEEYYNMNSTLKRTQNELKRLKKKHRWKTQLQEVDA